MVLDKNQQTMNISCMQTHACMWVAGSVPKKSTKKNNNSKLWYISSLVIYPHYRKNIRNFPRFSHSSPTQRIAYQEFNNLFVLFRWLCKQRWRVRATKGRQFRKLTDCFAFRSRDYFSCLFVYMFPSISPSSSSPTESLHPGISKNPKTKFAFKISF